MALQTTKKSRTRKDWAGVNFTEITKDMRRTDCLSQTTQSGVSMAPKDVLTSTKPAALPLPRSARKSGQPPRGKDEENEPVALPNSVPMSSRPSSQQTGDADAVMSTVPCPEHNPSADALNATPLPATEPILPKMQHTQVQTTSSPTQARPELDDIAPGLVDAGASTIPQKPHPMLPSPARTAATNIQKSNVTASSPACPQVAAAIPKPVTDKAALGAAVPITSPRKGRSAKRAHHRMRPLPNIVDATKQPQVQIVSAGQAPPPPPTLSAILHLADEKAEAEPPTKRPLLDDKDVKTAAQMAREAGLQLSPPNYYALRALPAQGPLPPAPGSLHATPPSQLLVSQQDFAVLASESLSEGDGAVPQRDRPAAAGSIKAAGEVLRDPPAMFGAATIQRGILKQPHNSMPQRSPVHVPVGIPSRMQQHQLHRHTSLERQQGYQHPQQPRPWQQPSELRCQHVGPAIPSSRQDPVQCPPLAATPAARANLPGAEPTAALAEAPRQPPSRQPPSPFSPGTSAHSPPLDISEYLPAAVSIAQVKDGPTRASALPAQLYPWQARCLSSDPGILAGTRNLVVAAPTGSGKTAIAETLLLRAVARGKKAMLVLPFVALCRQEAARLEKLLSPLGKNVRRAFGGEYTLGGLGHTAGIIVATPEHASSFLSRRLADHAAGIEPPLHQTFACIVIDEAHMLADHGGRGCQLELLLARLRFAAQTVADATHAAADTPGGTTATATATTSTTTLTETPGKNSPSSHLQIVAMSATLPNYDAMARWLDAVPFATDFRPVPLLRWLKKDCQLVDPEGNVVRMLNAARDDDPDHVAMLCQETLANSHSVLMFCATKQACEQEARSLSKVLSVPSRRMDGNARQGQMDAAETDEAEDDDDDDDGCFLSRQTLAAEMRTMKFTGAAVLADLVQLGVAYHHADLTSRARTLVEKGFACGAISVLCATSTLAAGVNLPARRVIFRTAMIGKDDLDASRYMQMAGRAGRKGIDDVGEAILIAPKKCSPDHIRKLEKLLLAQLPGMTSRLSDEGMERGVLDAIALRPDGATAQDMMRFARSTFLGTIDYKGAIRAFKSAADKLIGTWGMATWCGTSNTYSLTDLGKGTVLASFTPQEALEVQADLMKASHQTTLNSELYPCFLLIPVHEDSLIRMEQAQFTNLYHLLQACVDNRNPDAIVLESIGKAQLIKAAIDGMHGRQMKEGDPWARTCRRLYMAFILRDLINETSPGEIAAKYKVKSVAMLERLREGAARFGGRCKCFCEALQMSLLAVVLQKFVERTMTGTKEDILHLVSIKGVQSTVARLMYNAGFKSVEQIAKAKPKDIAKVLKNGPSSLSKSMSAQRRAEVIVIEACKKLKKMERIARLMDTTDRYGSDEEVEREGGSDVVRRQRQRRSPKRQRPGGHTEDYEALAIAEAMAENIGKAVVERTHQFLQEHKVGTGKRIDVEGEQQQQQQQQQQQHSPPAKRQRTACEVAKVAREAAAQAMAQGGPHQARINRVMLKSFVFDVAHAPEDACKPAAEPPKAPQSGPFDAGSTCYFVDKVARIHDLVAGLQACGCVGVQFLLDGPQHPYASGRVLGVALAWECNRQAFVPLHHSQGASTAFASAACTSLANLLASSDMETVFMKWKHQVAATRWLIRAGNDGNGNGIRGASEATFSETEKLGSELPAKPIDATIAARMAPQLPKIDVWDEDFGGRAAPVRRPKEVPVSAFKACRTAAEALRIYAQHAPHLKSSGQMSALHATEMPLVPVLADMESASVGLKTSVLLELRPKIEKRLKEIPLLIKAAAKEAMALHNLSHRPGEPSLLELDLNNTKHVQTLLFTVLRLNPPPTAVEKKASKAGKTYNAISTRKEVLELMMDAHPAVKLIIEYRKLKDTLAVVNEYLLVASEEVEKARAREDASGLPELPPAADDVTRIYTGFVQTESDTGRITMRDPNLQCLPKSHDVHIKLAKGVACSNVTEGGKHGLLQANLRAAIVSARPDRVLISADFRQNEFRLLAHLSGDEKMCSMLAEDAIDPFVSLAAAFFQCELDAVDLEQRDQMKQLFYAMMYGMGSVRLAEKLHIPQKQAEEMKASFFEQFPGVKSWMHRVLDECRASNAVTFLQGRKRFLPHINAKPNPNAVNAQKEAQNVHAIRAAAERAAINSVVQGSAADLCKIAMIKLHRRLCEGNPAMGLPAGAGALVLSIHDEILVEADAACAEIVAHAVKECMENAVQLNVPIRVKVRVGPSWGELRELS